MNGSLRDEAGMQQRKRGKGFVRKWQLVKGKKQDRCDIERRKKTWELVHVDTKHRN